jgi:hypothetical protein
LKSIVELGIPGQTEHMKINAPTARHNNNIGIAAGFFISEGSITPYLLTAPVISGEVKQTA